MLPKIANILLRIGGMTCVSCENKISRALNKTDGIQSAQASYVNSTVLVTFDANIISQEQIENLIESLDYQVLRQPPLGSPAGSGLRERVRSGGSGPGPVRHAGPGKPDANVRSHGKARQILGVAVILVALYVILKQLGGLQIFNIFPQAEVGMSYGLLFVIGLLTSLHCVAMCGGLNIAQCVPHPAQPATTGGAPSANPGRVQADRPGGVPEVSAAGPGRLASLKPSILYNAGRVISYTIIGGIVGALGSVISFSGWAKGIIALAAGLFMVIMGLNMLDLFPWLRRLTPRLPRFLARMIHAGKEQGNKSPLIIGLLNGLMPCGPLQAMQLYALSTGSFLAGALSMFVFSLGTVPLMFGLGSLSSLLSRKFTAKMLKVSAMLVVVLGIFMLQNGLGLSGLSLPSLASLWQGKADLADQSQLESGLTAQDGVQLVTTRLGARSYEPITVVAGVPVKWTIKAAADTINSCNNRLYIPAYKISKQLTAGDNIIEFTPTQAGTFPYSCWMGMIRSRITVVKNPAG